jgi:CubicO group peptidase (beta-lactamase class C family)
MTIQDELEAIADEHDFSGVVAVSRDGQRLAELARGFADRANRRPNTLETPFATASLTKGLTALTVASLIQAGELAWDTAVRGLIPDDLPLIDDAVTIEQLLGHTSGIGDYLDEDALGDVDDYIMPIPVQELATPSDYLRVIEGYEQRSPPGTAFAYNNGAYVLLSILVEKATGRSYYDLVEERVTKPAGMTDTRFERSDRLPPGAALGYLEDGRTNVLHLPVRGAGDGGVYSTVRDLESLWPALFAGRIVPLPVVDRMIAPRSVSPDGRRYGLGFWLDPDGRTVFLEGMDAGVSSRAARDPSTGAGYVVISNTSSGTWPMARHLDERLGSLANE